MAAVWQGWIIVWQCDFRSKKSCVLMNFITTSDEASEESEFLSALNASLECFVHKTLKDILIECIHRILSYGRDVFGPATNIPKVLFRMGCTANATSKTTTELLVFCWLTKWKGTLTKWHACRTKIAFLVLLLKLTHYERNRRTCFSK